jgi:hypothetical protein
MELVAEPRDARRSAHGLDARLERRPHVGGIVDPGRDLPQLPAGPQLVEHRWRDAQASRQPVHARRRRAGRPQPFHQAVDPLRHLRLERRRDVGQADPAAVAGQPAVIGHLVDHATEIRVFQRQGNGSAVARRRLPTRGRAHTSDQRVHAHVDRQWLLSVELPQGRKDEALGDAPLIRIDGTDRHGT